MKRTAFLAMLLVGVLALSACAAPAEVPTVTPTPAATAATQATADPEPTAQPTAEPTAQPTAEPSAEPAAAETVYPLTISNYNYAKEPVEITFSEPPKKVLAVYQNSIETLLALGLEDHILACSGLDHAVKPEYEAAFAKVNYLTEFAPDKESVVMMEPDFILSWYSFFGERTLGEVDYWHERSINTYMMLNSGCAPTRTLENEYADILDIGKIFSVQGKAEAIVSEIQAEVTKVTDHAAQAAEKRKVAVIEFGRENIRVYGETTLGGDMVLKLGADLISTEGGTMGAEDLIGFDPDVIFVVYMDRENEDMATASINRILDDPKYASLKATANKDVFAIPLGEMYCSGVRTIDGITRMAKGIYPDLYQ